VAWKKHISTRIASKRRRVSLRAWKAKQKILVAGRRVNSLVENTKSAYNGADETADIICN